MARPDWDTYFFDLANLVSTRATCPRRSVGCVIVKDHRVLATGYNGSPPGHPHCLDEGCIIEDNHCTRTVHAEANAIATAARFGVSLEGATAYVNFGICPRCEKLLTTAGVRFRAWNAS